MLLSIIVPVYREGDAARPVLTALAEGAPRPHEILVVHDEADDPTVPVVQALQASFPELRPVHNQLGRGPALALRAGFAAARGDAVLVTMADASDEIADVVAMLDRIADGYDLVAASRYMRGGRQLGGPALKGFLSRSAGLTLHWLTGLPTADPTSAFKMYRKSMLDRLAIESGYRITEVPTTWRDRVEGQSSFKLLRWLPRYLQWYALAMRKGLGRGRARALRAPL
jgi:glycosyltransferase involved in cell wall biosynthesis